ncbi:MAG TPA: 2-phospho-L-lactate transferase [Actinomycetota bacterium]|nr:2-phospho-L-lactate transferase [Actinomycetota bacterium]
MGQGERIVTLKVTALAGGVGAARFLRGLIMATRDDAVTVIGNTGDDSVMHGLHISPDLDIVAYTLAGIVDSAGWGIAGDTTNALQQMGRYGIETWFTLKDRDIGTHMARTHLLADGLSLAEVTDRIRTGLGIGARLIPMSNDPVRTKIVTVEGQIRDFQEYFVKLRHSDEVAGVEFDGAGSALPAPGVLEAIETADLIIVCPSNPVLSIGPILSVPGIRQAMARRRSEVVAISPIIAGSALKGPAATLLPVVGAEASAAGVAGLYRDFCGTMVLDNADAARVPAVEALGMRALVTKTVMHTPADAKQLAKEILEL